MKTNSFLTLALFLATAIQSKAAKPTEGKLDPFLGKPVLESKQVFKNGRMPNVVVAMDGSILAVWNGVICRKSVDGGETFGKVIEVGKGFMGGGVTVDETTGSIFAFVEDGHPPSKLTVYRSEDNGKTWEKHDCEIKKDKEGNMPSMHMNEHGITLRHGEHKGRIIRPSRWYAGKNHNSRWPKHYTNAIYSDDRGKTWHASEPFPEQGTGEACIVELSDGTLYYNSRVHWEKAERNTRRRCAFSRDGGKTWEDWRIVDILPDGHQHRSYGCMGGLARLPVKGRDILVFSNLDTPKANRERITVWMSPDGGQTWPVKRLVYDGASAYSSMSAGRSDTPSEGSVYLMFEGGPGGGAQIGRFNLAWVLQGELTGDGEIPDWLKVE